VIAAVIMYSPFDFSLNALLLPLLGIPVFIIGIGFIVWLRIRTESRENADRLRKRIEKKQQIALHGAQLGDEILNQISLQDMQGCWKMVSVGRNGNFAPPEFFEQEIVRFVIEGVRFAIEPRNTTGTLKVDNSFEPVHFDRCDDDGGVHLCIVRIRNDELEICESEIGADRPQSFDPERKDNASLTRFKRIE
jgi:uncharacterized protein (TIGR03067 family)